MRTLFYLLNFCLFTQYTNADQSLQCGEWYVYKDEKCFKVYNNTDVHTYENAKNKCYENEGSSLVTIQSLEEQQILFDLLSSKQKIVNDVWIGGQYLQNTFKWTDNSNVNFTNWANGYPRSESGYECIKMSIVEPYGKWLNCPCNQSYVVVCQKPQNWLFSYLQQTVMELRESVANITRKLENTESELRNTKAELQQDIIKRSSEATPAGTVAYFTNTTAPIGWLKANGQSVSRTTYANLFATIGVIYGSGDGSTTFTLPDLRGEFIRGWSDGSTVDQNRIFGSSQVGSVIPFAGRINGTYAAGSFAHQNRYGVVAGNTFDNGYENNIASGLAKDGMTYPNDSYSNDMDYIPTTNRGFITTWNALKGTRPRNVALLACVKY